jgi:hypothetical protein
MHQAMNEINAARRLRVAAFEKAEAQKVGLGSGAHRAEPLWGGQRVYAPGRLRL